MYFLSVSKTWQSLGGVGRIARGQFLTLVLSSSPSTFSWVKKFGEHNGLDILLNILKSCCVGDFQGKDAILRRIQYQCVRSLKAFMNNKVNSQRERERERERERRER